MPRLDVLKESLAKKEAVLDSKLTAHFDDVASANGQPLNDKRNGQATMNRWDKQSDSIRNQKLEIEKTKNAIDREEEKINYTKYYYDLMPEYIRKMIDDGVLKQWRKHPSIMFVEGVSKARICFNEKSGMCTHRYVSEITDKKEFEIFRDTFNAINKIQNDGVKDES